MRLRLLIFCLAVGLVLGASPSRAEDVFGFNTPPAYGDPAPRKLTSKNVRLPGDDDVPTAAEARSDDLWARVRNGFALPDLDTPLVQENEEWYTNRPDYVRRMTERSRRYLFHIVNEVENRGMPMEIALLPFIESAFNPKAFSRAKASGIWQFIPSTGKNFGLQQDFWFDGRRDIAAATNAALNYLQKLHDMFGDWPLALAAYNWGEGNVARAIAKNQARGLPTDYLSLTMPPETRNYVPRLLAVKNVVADPAAHGLTLASVPNRPYFATVTVNQNIDVKLAAKLAEMQPEEFASLNPGHNRPVIRAKGGLKLLLPVDKTDIFATNLEFHDKPLVSWQTYTARKGEGFQQIASRFGLSVAQLKDINDISTKARKPAPGQTFLVPGGDDDGKVQLADVTPPPAPEPEAKRGETTRTVTRKMVHTVAKGDTLASIARRYDVSVADLKHWNKLKNEKLALKQKLTLQTETVVAMKAKDDGKRVSVMLAAHHPDARETARPAKGEKTGKSAKSAKATRYVVKKGDTLQSIARHFKVAVNDIQRWNNLSPKRLMPGTTVTVYPDS